MSIDGHDVLARIPPFAGRRLDGAQVEPLGSLTNRTFKVTLDGAAYVLRIPGEGTAAYIDRAAEAHNARLAASIGIAPDILYADARSGIMVTRFVPGGTPLAAEDLQQPGTLRRAAELLGRLHGSRLAFAGRMELFPKLDQYIALAADKGWSGAPDLSRLRRQAEIARAALERGGTPLVPSHIDPVPNNFVRGTPVDGASALYLLDWEYAAMADPMWDLAALSIEAALSAAQDQVLLEAYASVPAARPHGRFILHKTLLHLLAAAWAAVQLVDGNRSADFAAYLRQRLALHGALTESPEYRESIAAL